MAPDVVKPVLLVNAKPAEAELASSAEIALLAPVSATAPPVEATVSAPPPMSEPLPFSVMSLAAFRPIVVPLTDPPIVNPPDDVRDTDDPETAPDVAKPLPSVNARPADAELALSVAIVLLPVSATDPPLDTTVSVPPPISEPPFSVMSLVAFNPIVVALTVPVTPSVPPVEVSDTAGAVMVPPAVIAGADTLIVCGSDTGPLIVSGIVLFSARPVVDELDASVVIAFVPSSDADVPALICSVPAESGTPPVGCVMSPPLNSWSVPTVRPLTGAEAENCSDVAVVVGVDDPGCV
jgi:hypothetical protein